MKLWMSGEIMLDVEESSRLASNEIEEFINANIEKIDYGAGVKEWSYIVIMRPKGDEYYPEIYKYHKRDKDAEFRLRIDYEKFKTSSEIEQRKLICESLLR